MRYYGSAMEKPLDKLAILIGCAACLISTGAPLEPSTVAAALTALSCTALCEAAPPRARAALALAACVPAALAPGAAVLMALPLYDLAGLAHEPGPEHLGLAPATAMLALGLARHSGAAADGALLAAAVCALACTLSLRTHALLARRTLAQRARDDFAARAHSLKERNEGLAAELDEARKAFEGSASRDAAAPDAWPDELAGLTQREREVARLVAEGLDNREIAATAFMSEGTVRNRISSILAKCHLKSRTQIAIAFWRR